MKYQFLSIDNTEGTTSRMKEKDVPTGLNPIAYVAARLKAVGGIVGAIIFGDDGKPVTTITFWQGDRWLIFDHKEQDWTKPTLGDMEGL